MDNEFPVYGIIPVKSLQDGKSRLRGVLSDREREAQNRRFLQRTLSLAESFLGSAFTIVVSRSDEVLDTARLRGMITLTEVTDSDLNRALALATALALERSAKGMLYLPVDLPFAAPETLRRIITNARRPSLVLVPDRHLQGTNVLFQSPIRLHRFAFGQDSFREHVRLGQEAGFKPRVTSIQSLTFDIDDPNDMAYFDTLDKSRAHANH
jgi:2-phospho-L-lactate guanylyltransferase